ncbi:hypothetical protein [Nonomuraea sp. GTA35]|uniref:hypothetical protein n=1 Tax=Nonomuraea sp. GTA35 TaxID=1676746 RepID=UPI0035C168D0
MTRTYTFEQAAEIIQVVTASWLLKQRRKGNIEATPFGRGWILTEQQMQKLLTEGVPTEEQRKRPQRTPKQAAPRKPRQPKPARPATPNSGASEPLVFDRTRSHRYRSGDSA